MDNLRPLFPLLWLILGGLALLLLTAIIFRVARTRYLRRVTLTPERIRQWQIDLTDAARRASIQPGMEVPLLRFWKGSKLKEPDRQAVINPLVESNVFGWYERRSANDFENVWNDFWRWVWRPTRDRVIVSQWVKDDSSRGESVTFIIEKVLGGIDMSQTDNSITFGPRAGRDVIGGDMVGRDKAGRDTHGVSAGENVAHSANAGSVHQGNVNLTTPAELTGALMALADEAEALGEALATVNALRWAAHSASSSQAPDPQELARNQRTLDRAGTWTQAGLKAIAEGVTGALAGHWLMTVLQS